MTTTLRSFAALSAHPASVSHIQPGFELRRVSSRDDWRRVKGLRYEALRSRDEIRDDPQCAYGDEHDLAPNAMTFLLTRNGRPVASTRSSVSSARRQWRLPAMEAFGREIEAGIGLDCKIVEASLVTVDPVATADPKTLLFHLLKAHMLHCAAEDADWLLVAVRDSQIGFHRRMFNMEILSGAETYPGMASSRVLMGLEYRRHAPLLMKRIPVLAIGDEDEREFAANGNVCFGLPHANAAMRREAVARTLAAD
jgi:hypothetical protein